MQILDGAITLLMSPSTRREWIEIGRPIVYESKTNLSPSTRREWIEMRFYPQHHSHEIVSLHTEGVD
mgnify:CR=1 FL=1